MHVCLLSSEFLGLGSAGGFGFATRSLGSNLAACGHQVTVVIPQPIGIDSTDTTIDSMRIVTVPRPNILSAGPLYRAIDADIYHSQEPSLSSYVAQRALPGKIHVVTVRDPRELRDWAIEIAYPTRSRIGVLRTLAFYENPLTRKAVRQASRVYTPAHCLVAKARRKYRLSQAPEFMPTPISCPKVPLTKAEQPTFSYVGRLDRRKRPELFLSLAPRFPNAQLIVVGAAQDPSYEKKLMASYGAADNVRFLGFIDQFSDDQLSAVLAKTWILVNTAAREGLPNVFIEAAMHGCAIVSEHDPDGFASRFGRHCPDGHFASAISQLLDRNRWRSCGAAGAEYALATNEAGRATKRHLASYNALLGK